MNNDTPADAITVTLEDRMLAEQWRFIECMHCSQYEGDFVNDLAEDFAHHRTTSLAAQDGLVEAFEDIIDHCKCMDGMIYRADLLEALSAIKGDKS